MSVINGDDDEDVEDDADDAVVVVGGCIINPQPLIPATSNGSAYLIGDNIIQCENDFNHYNF